MAFRRRLGNLADLLLRSHLQSQQAERQSRLNNENDLLRLAIGDPTGKLAETLVKAGRGRVAGTDLASMIPSPESVTAGLGSDLAKANTLQELPTDLDLEPQLRSRPGGEVASRDPRAIEQLIAQRNARQGMITEAPKKTAVPQPVKSLTDKGVEQTTYLTPYEAAKQGPFVQERTGEQEGARTAAATVAANSPEAVASEAGKAGKIAGARAEAEMPFQMKLAKTRADMNLLNQEAINDYRMKHPRATAQELNRQSGAVAALQLSKIARMEAEELDKRGMMGPIAGRLRDIASGKIKAEDLFKSPEDATLAAKFASDIGLLTSLAANVHAGARGAGSVGILNHFEKILSSAGDLSIMNGQLDAIDQIMNIYAKEPRTPELNLKQFGIDDMVPPGPAQTPQGPASIDPSILQLLQRNPNGR